MMHIFERSSGIHTGAIGAALASSGIAALIALTHAAFFLLTIHCLAQDGLLGAANDERVLWHAAACQRHLESVTSRSSSV